MQVKKDFQGWLVFVYLLFLGVFFCLFVFLFFYFHILLQRKHNSKSPEEENTKNTLYKII